jgi:hypothetical protein
VRETVIEGFFALRSALKDACSRLISRSLGLFLNEWHSDRFLRAKLVEGFRDALPCEDDMDELIIPLCNTIKVNQEPGYLTEADLEFFYALSQV